MKVTTLLPVTLAVAATAEVRPYALPTPAKRDLETLTSVITQISGAVTQLDESVKAFVDDPTKLESDAANLLTTIKDGASTLTSEASDFSLDDIAGLQGISSDLAVAGNNLLEDLQAKQVAFESSGFCSKVRDTLKSFGEGAGSFFDGIVGKLPDAAQEPGKKLLDSIADEITKRTTNFKCEDNGAGKEYDGGEGSGAYPTMSYPALSSSTADPASSSSSCESDVSTSSSALPAQSSQCIAVTVTVAAPCACESATSTSSISIPTLTPGTTTAIITTSSISVPYPTGLNSTTSIIPTGGVTTTPSTTTPIATAGAGANGVGAVGLMAGLAAALFV